MSTVIDMVISHPYEFATRRFTVQQRETIFGRDFEYLSPFPNRLTQRRFRSTTITHYTHPHFGRVTRVTNMSRPAAVVAPSKSEGS